MKKGLVALMFGLALAAAPGVANAHEYDRDDSDYPLRLVSYAIYPFGIAAEYLVLRPIHWVVSQPNLDIIFGHEKTEADADTYGHWE